MFLGSWKHVAGGVYAATLKQSILPSKLNTETIINLIIIQLKKRGKKRRKKKYLLIKEHAGTRVCKLQLLTR